MPKKTSRRKFLVQTGVVSAGLTLGVNPVNAAGRAVAANGINNNQRGGGIETAEHIRKRQAGVMEASASGQAALSQELDGGRTCAVVAHQG